MVIEYPIESLSCWDKNSYLKNITQFPGDSGNADRGVCLKAVGRISDANKTAQPVIRVFEGFDKAVRVEYSSSGVAFIYYDDILVWDRAVDSVEQFDIIAMRILDGRYIIWCANGIIWKFNIATKEISNVDFSNGYCVSLDEINHRLIAADDATDKWYYTKTGTLEFDWLGGYTAEFMNAKPLRVRRISNRLVVFSDKSVEFWDATDNYNEQGENLNPFSTAYQQNVITGAVKLASIILLGDNLYFAMRLLSTGNYRICRLSPNGELQALTEPNFEDKLKAESIKYASIYNIGSSTFLAWRGQEVYNYNVGYGKMFLTDQCLASMFGLYYNIGGREFGAPDDYSNNKEVRFINTDNKGKNFSVIKATMNIKCYSNARHPERLVFKGSRVGVAFDNIKNVLIRNLQGERELACDAWSFGLGIDFNLSVSFAGMASINRAFIEI